MRAAVCLFVAACSSSTKVEPTVDLAQTVTHPDYHVRAALPAGWVAEASHAPIYPADMWFLHRAGTQGPPMVVLLLAWQPRGGRHSGAFPGERSQDAHPTTRMIGGTSRAGTVEDEDRHFYSDFNVGELVVSASTVVKLDEDRRIVDAILAGLVFDPAAHPPQRSPERDALELARTWARDHGFTPDTLVYTGTRSGQHAFTLFQEHGLIALHVDLDKGTVTRDPL